MATPRILLSLIVVVVAVPLLAGCVPDGDKPVGEATSTPTPTPTTEPLPEAGPAFVAPGDCATLTGPTLAAEFEAQDIVLFDSTTGEGLHAGLGEGAPQQTGGETFYCLFGQDMVDLSSFQLEAQALTESAHEAVIEVLDGSGLVESVDGDVITYTQTGDDRGTPTIVHELRPDSWLTAWSAFGGQQQVTLMTGYLDAVAAQNYAG